MRTIKQVDVVDGCFHNLRHEATTRLFKKGLNIVECREHNRAQGFAHAATVYAIEGRLSGAEVGEYRASFQLQRLGMLAVLGISLRSLLSNCEALFPHDSDWQVTGQQVAVAAVSNKLWQ